MNIVLWIISALLAIFFLAVGSMKLTRSKESLAASGLAWTQDFSAGTVKLIGALEALAAIGLILPALSGVAQVLVPLAASGLVLLMAGAAITHARRNEPQMIVFNVALLILAAVVAWGRFGPYSFTS
jgi:hypothetical protein